jgi:hypothetical protein
MIKKAFSTWRWPCQAIPDSEFRNSLTYRKMDQGYSSGGIIAGGLPLAYQFVYYGVKLD